MRNHGSRLEAARAAIEHACRAATSLPDVFAGVAAGLTRVVPVDEFCLNSLDPATLQETFSFHTLRPTPRLLARFFEIETGGRDVNAVPTLAGDPTGAATLHQATDGDPARSARYRDVLRPLGLGRELSVVVRDRRVSWGMVNLFRGADAPDFSEEEVGFVSSLGRTIADGIRRTLVLGAIDTTDATDTGPGVLIVDLTRPEQAHHRSPGAEHWLTDLDDADWHVCRIARQADTVGGAAHTHVCTRNGRWLTLHAEPYGETSVSVVVEPTRPAAISDLVMGAYGLSAREREIVTLLAGGHTNAEISRLLGLSPHTVGDHVKHVFGKLAVHSRGELTSRLFFGPHLSTTQPFASRASISR